MQSASSLEIPDILFLFLSLRFGLRKYIFDFDGIRGSKIDELSKLLTLLLFVNHFSNLIEFLLVLFVSLHPQFPLLSIKLIVIE